MKILIVDDEMMITEWFKYTISSMPLEISLVETASNGEEALRKIRNEYYDLIFIDVMMPKMNGLDMLKKLNEQTVDSMLIVISSHDEFKFAKEAIKYNVKEYVLKNECSKEKLLEIIYECHEKKLNKQITNSINQDFMERVLNDNIPSTGLSIVNKMFPEIANKTFFVAAAETIAPNSPNIFEGIGFRLKMEGLIGGIEDISFYLFTIHRKENVKTFNYDYSKLLYQKINTKISCGRLCRSPEEILPECRNSWIGYQSLYYSTSRHSSGRSQYREFDSKTTDGHCDKVISNIRSYSKEKTILTLKEINSYFEKIKPTDIEAVINIYLALLSTFIIYNNKKSRQVTEELESLRTKIHSFENFRDLSDWAIQVIENNAELINRNKFSPAVEKALEYIEENYKDIESISQIADHVNLSLDYFSRHFKKEAGITLNSYLINFRLDKASLILISSDLSIQEVALMVGIENGGYFSKCFKKKFHIQPIHFRIQRKSL